MQDVERRLARLVDGYARKSAVHGLQLAVERPGWSWTRTDADGPYVIASVSKLFTTAVVLQLRHEALLDLDAPVAAVLGAETVRGLVVVDGVDHGDRITARHLLAHTSGVPDYYSQPDEQGHTLAASLLSSARVWRTEELLERARVLTAPFPPGEGPLAHYSDTNFLLLGLLVRAVTGQDLPDAVRDRVLDPLGLTGTRYVLPQEVGRPLPAAAVYDGPRPVDPTPVLASGPAEGGLLSTTADQRRFLRAIVSGELFPTSMLADATATWRSLTGSFGPLRYGTGLMRFALPRWKTLGARMPELIGHSGSSGSFAFHAPDFDLTVVGSVNQTTPAGLPYPLLARVARLCAAADRSEAVGQGRQHG